MSLIACLLKFHCAGNCPNQDSQLMSINQYGFLLHVLMNLYSSLSLQILKVSFDSLISKIKWEKFPRVAYEETLWHTSLFLSVTSACERLIFPCFNHSEDWRIVLLKQRHSCVNFTVQNTILWQCPMSRKGNLHIFPFLLSVTSNFLKRRGTDFLFSQ